MDDVFLNLANFAQYALLTLAPPSKYALNLKALYRGSSLSTIFGIWKKSYYVKFVLVVYYIVNFH